MDIVRLLQMTLMGRRDNHLGETLNYRILQEHSFVISRETATMMTISLSAHKIFSGINYLLS